MTLLEKPRRGLAFNSIGTRDKSIKITTKYGFTQIDEMMVLRDFSLLFLLCSLRDFNNHAYYSLSYYVINHYPILLSLPVVLYYIFSSIVGIIKVEINKNILIILYLNA